MEKVLEGISYVVQVLLGFAGAITLLASESVHDSFVGLGCFLLLATWRLGLIEAQSRRQTDLLIELVAHDREARRRL